MNSKIEVFNHEQFGEIRTVYNKENDEIWFVGKDVVRPLGHKNISDALSRHVDIEDKDEIPIMDSIGRMQKTPIINKDGIVSLISRSSLLTQLEKEKFLISLGIDDKIVLQSRAETEFGEQLMLFMNQLGYKIETQYKILEYYIDFYIPELNIAIEYDEEQHKYSYNEDKQRELEIQKEIGCKFIRVEDGLNIGTQLGQIVKYIMEEI